MPPRALFLSRSEPRPAQQRAATPPPSSAPARPDSVVEEVRTVAQRIRRVLHAIKATRMDTERIDAHRDAVRRELGLSQPIL